MKQVRTLFKTPLETVGQLREELDGMPGLTNDCQLRIEATLGGKIKAIRISDGQDASNQR